MCRAGGLEDYYFSGDIRGRGYADGGAGQEDVQSFELRLRGRAHIYFTERVYGEAELIWQPWYGRGGEAAWEYEEPVAGRSFVRLENPLYLPLSLEAGRLTYGDGDGLLFSERDSVWLFDGGGLSYDVPDRQAGIRYIQPAHTSPDSMIRQVLWADYEEQWDVVHAQLYGGWLQLEHDGDAGAFGGRLQVETGPLSAVIEGVGQSGSREKGETLLAGLGACTLVYQLADGRQKSWQVSGRGTYATGGGANERHAFIPMFNYNDDWGQVFSPDLSNIAVLEGGIGQQPALDERGVRLLVRGYAQAQQRVQCMSSGQLGMGGYSMETGGESRWLGMEVDGEVWFHVRDSVRVEVSGGYFGAGDAYDSGGAYEVRLEVEVVF